jgi:Icc protein
VTLFGQHPAPAHVIAHVSDTHFLGGERPLFGKIPTDDNLLRALVQLERSGANPEAIVFTGDLADLAEPDAYARLREIVEPAAERMGARIIWVMGNHDERLPFATALLDEVARPGVDMPSQDHVHDINGLRIIALDSTVPGYHHGDLTDDQLAWLTDVLATPAPHGTIIAMHHPPIPTPLALMALLELRNQTGLATVIRGTDVRGILAGHLHYTTHSTFAGVPVSVAAATCYTMDVSARPNTMSGVDGAQAFNLVHVYADSVVHSVVPIGAPVQVSGFSDVFIDRIAALAPEERLEAFSRKTSAGAQSHPIGAGSAA